MRPQRGTQGLVIGHQVFTYGWHRQVHWRFRHRLHLGKQGQLRLNRRHLPACLVPVTGQGTQRPAIGQAGPGP
ncbi:hypothetical protein D3C81_1793700 [compost metagenome]